MDGQAIVTGAHVLAEALAEHAVQVVDPSANHGVDQRIGDCSGVAEKGTGVHADPVGPEREAVELTRAVPVTDPPAAIDEDPTGSADRARIVRTSARGRR